MSPTKKDGFTLAESLITLVLLSILIMMVYMSFGIMDNAKRWNEKITAEFYNDRNIDTMFSILENEIKYSGSLSMVLKKFDNGVFEPDANAGIYASNDKELIIQYASVEPLFFNISEETECIAYSSGKIAEPNIISPSEKWFTLYQNSLYTLGELKSDFFEVININKTPGAEIEKSSTITIEPPVPDDGDWLFFIRNISTTQGSPVILDDDNYYYGELIAKVALEYDDSEKLIKMEKSLPWNKSTNTATSSSYQSNLLNDVEEFRITYGYNRTSDPATQSIRTGNYSEVVDDVGNFQDMYLKYVKLYVKINNIDYENPQDTEYFERERVFWLPGVL